jgi:hypothetical protein
MIYIIISIDPSTTFLNEIIDRLTSKKIDVTRIEIHASKDPYVKELETIKNIPDYSTIIFLGHGQSEILWGGESSVIKKRELVDSREMKIFNNKNLFLLACDSAKLLRGSLLNFKLLKSIGFGGLPTEMYEIESSKKLLERGVTEEVLDEFKNAIIETVSDAFIYHLNSKSNDFYNLKNYLSLLINKRINKAVLEEDSRKLADLLFEMKNEMAIY